MLWSECISFYRTKMSWRRTGELRGRCDHFIPNPCTRRSIISIFSSIPLHPLTTDRRHLLLIASGGDDNALSILVNEIPARSGTGTGSPGQMDKQALQVVARILIPDAHDSLISGKSIARSCYVREDGMLQVGQGKRRTG